MARPFHQLLAESLTRVKAASIDGVVTSDNMSRRDRERLSKGGWLVPVISGWHLLCSPQAKEGESTAWYASYWSFISQYLKSRFDGEYVRIGRFIMNVLWVTAGYPWTIIRVESRTQYLKSLELASVNNLITDFVKLISQEMDVKW